MVNRIFLLVSMLVAWALQGQSQLGLYNFNSIHQSSFLNVSNHSDYKFSLGLPGIGSVYAAMGNTGFSIPKGLIDSVARYPNGELEYWNKGKFVDDLRAKNMAYFTTSLDWISFRFKVKHSYYSFNVTDNFEFRTLYPKDLFGVLRDGNSQYIGGQAVLSDFRVNSQYYREYAVGYQHEHEQQKWSYGFRLKLLQGLASLHTSKSTTTVSVAPNEIEGNDINVKSDIIVNTSYNKQFEGFDTLSSSQRNNLFLTDFSNMGFALDLGASHKINKRLTVSGSINNLGFIRWKENPHNYKFKGEATFKGVVVKDASKIDENTFQPDTILESLKNSFKFDTTYQKYTSSLVGSSSLTLNYQIARGTSANALLFMNYYKGARFSGSLGIQQKLGRWLAVTAYWGAQYGKFDNLGFGLMVKPGPVQIYVLCDNITPYLKAIDGQEVDFAKIDYRNSNIRFGMNIAVGRIPKPEAQTFSDN